MPETSGKLFLIPSLLLPTYYEYNNPVCKCYPPTVTVPLDRRKSANLVITVQETGFTLILIRDGELVATKSESCSRLRPLMNLWTLGATL
jgi:hypothetical protein